MHVNMLLIVAALLHNWDVFYWQN